MKGMSRLQVNGQKIIYRANTNQKEAREASRVESRSSIVFILK